MRLGQALGLWLIADTNLRMGVGRFTGMSGAWEFLSGAEPRREAPAQGPRFDDSSDGATGGALPVLRHPNKPWPALIVCFQPPMNARLFTLVFVRSPSS